MRSNRGDEMLWPSIRAILIHPEVVSRRPTISRATSCSLAWPMACLGWAATQPHVVVVRQKPNILGACLPVLVSIQPRVAACLVTMFSGGAIIHHSSNKVHLHMMHVKESGEDLSVC